MSDELREKIWRLYWEKWQISDVHAADAAIALIRAEVLEEAAKAVDAEWGMILDADVKDILRIIRDLKDKP